jgi:hypothetical protein
VPDWITTADVAGALGGSVTDDPSDTKLTDSTAAARAAVERRRSDLDFSDVATVPADVRTGSIAWAVVLYQSGTAPAGFSGYDAETALMEAGSRRAEILRLIGWRRPVTA